MPLSAHPLHMRTLANLTVDYHALMLLVYYTVTLLGHSEHPLATSSATPSPLTPPPSLIPPLLRALSSLHKSYTCSQTVPLVYACMESLGGVGYRTSKKPNLLNHHPPPFSANRKRKRTLTSPWYAVLNDESQHINIARLFRDACVGAIWEGTTDVLASDTLRAVTHAVSGSETVRGLGWFIETGLKASAGGRWKGAEVKVKAVWEGLMARVEREGVEGLLADARGWVFRLAEVLVAVLFMVDAVVHPGEEIEEMCWRYLVKKEFLEEGGEGRLDLAMDQAIVYGVGRVPGQEAAAAAGSKL